MILLALESSAESWSAALWDAGGIDKEIAFERSDRTPGRADRLVELAAALMDRAGPGWPALGAIAVNHGPGSFTGVRGAVAAARGFALAAGLPVVAVSGLEALAGAAAPSGDAPILAAIDARRSQVYARTFAPDLRPLDEPAALDPARVAARIAGRRHVLVGSGAPLVAAALSEPARAPIAPVELDARAIAREAARRLAGGALPQPGFALRPLYLREPDARPQAPAFPAPAAAG